MNSTDIEIFFSKINKTENSEECFEWTGGRHAKGYGVFHISKIPYRAHRIAYEIEHGPIPPKLEVLHLCDNPGCVNPRHLRLGTHKENMQDMSAKGRAGGQLPAELVATLREEFTGKWGEVVMLARKYGLHPRTVGRYLKGWDR